MTVGVTHILQEHAVYVRTPKTCCPKIYHGLRSSRNFLRVS
jgi:hypothetical protein